MRVQNSDPGLALSAGWAAGLSHPRAALRQTSENSHSETAEALTVSLNGQIGLIHPEIQIGLVQTFAVLMM